MKKLVIAFLFSYTLIFAEFPVDIVDDVGISTTITKQPERIISLAPSNTEILFALGLADRVVGVTRSCDFPSNAKKKEKVGDFNSPDIEKILFLKPDLVLTGGGIQRELILKLKGFKIPAITLYPKNLNQVLMNIVIIGKVTGKVEEALLFTGKLKERINKIRDKLKNLNEPKVYFEIWNFPFTTAGKGSFIDELITLAGGKNIMHDIDKTFPDVSAEEIIKRNPEIIITGYMQKDGEIKKDILNRNGWEHIDAVKNKKVYDDINADLLLRPGPRLIDGLEELARRFHKIQ